MKTKIRIPSSLTVLSVSAAFMSGVFASSPEDGRVFTARRLPTRSAEADAAALAAAEAKRARRAAKRKS